MAVACSYICIDETPMKLPVKFTLLFVLVFGSGQALAGFFLYRFLEANARNGVIQQARLMLQSALSIREYTESEITPLLDTPKMRQTDFLPQTIPFYAATQSFNAFRHYYPDYAYKEATRNPTNPRDRAVDWEADVITQFQNNRSADPQTIPSYPSHYSSQYAAPQRTLYPMGNSLFCTRAGFSTRALLGWFERNKNAVDLFIQKSFR